MKIRKDQQEIIDAAEELEALGFNVTGIIGGAHPVPSVSVQPDITLSSWRVYEVSSKQWSGRTRHFSGDTGYEGRASTPIKTFDNASKIGQTESGRKYQLRGSPGGNRDSDYIWGVFSDINGMYDIVDVSEEYDNPTTISR